MITEDRLKEIELRLYSSFERGWYPTADPELRECTNSLIEEIRMLRKALEFYAKNKHQVITVNSETGAIISDNGNHARQALGIEK